MQKAQNLIEVSLVLVLVVVVSLTMWPIFNNQKMKLANLSKANINTTQGSLPGGGQNIFDINTTGQKIIELATDMQFNINSPMDVASLLLMIDDKIHRYAAQGARTAYKTEKYNSKFMEILNELAKSPTVNTAENISKATAIANSMSINVSSNAQLSDVMTAINSELITLMSSTDIKNESKWAQIDNYYTQYIDLLSSVAKSTVANIYIYPSENTPPPSSPGSRTQITGKYAWQLPAGR